MSAPCLEVSQNNFLFSANCKYPILKPTLLGRFLYFYSDCHLSVQLSFLKSWGLCEVTNSMTNAVNKKVINIYKHDTLLVFSFGAVR